MCDCKINDFRKNYEKWDKHYFLQHTGDAKGLGLFCGKKFGKDLKGGVLTEGDFVGEMTGILRPPGYDFGKKDGYSVRFRIGNCRRPSVWGYVDPYDTGSYMRFVNHSCDSNCEFQHSRVGNTRISSVVVKKGKTLRAGDEITTDYGPGYFENIKECYCGTSQCRKPPQNDDDEEDDDDEKYDEDDEDEDDKDDEDDDEDDCDDGDDRDGDSGEGPPPSDDEMDVDQEDGDLSPRQPKPSSYKGKGKGRAEPIQESEDEMNIDEDEESDNEIGTNGTGKGYRGKKTYNIISSRSALEVSRSRKTKISASSAKPTSYKQVSSHARPNPGDLKRKRPAVEEEARSDQSEADEAPHRSIKRYRRRGFK
ncbi:SET domain-containing protein [Lophium mytilinum]|uniref:SET domain-containing protein n=1 Tax=Lophium mytilinum TaxID=390894 RepID=A0A6A6Q8F3_9PEZI|nr:SET domain-containing protein [Lophium mytilinum]